MKNNLLSFLFLVISVCTAMKGQDTDLAVANIDASLTQKAHSVVRYHHVLATMKGGTVEYNYQVAITVLNAKHADYLHVSVPYEEAMTKITDFEIEYLDENGARMKKVKNKEIDDNYYNDVDLISIQRYKQFRYYTDKYPVTVVYSYRKKEQNALVPDGWAPLETYNMSLEQASYELTTDGQAVAAKERNLERYGIPSSDDLTYTVENVTPVRKEKLMPGWASVFPHVAFYPSRIRYFDHETDVTNWEGLSQWIYTDMFEPQGMDQLVELKSELDKEIGHVKDKLAIAKLLYEYVQESTRYVLISLDDGGYVPLSVETVHDKKYGDCKALAYYYKTLTDMYDIECELAFIKAGGEKKEVDKDYIAPTYFNHVINRLTIDGKYHWVDCTSSLNPFGYIGAFNEGRTVLLSGGDNAGLGSTPALVHKQVVTTDYTITDTGVLSGTYSQSNQGARLGSKLSLFQCDSKETEEYQTDRLFAQYENVDVQEYSYKVDTASLQMSENYTISVPHQLESMGDYRLLPISRHKLPVPKLKKDKKREFDIVFDRDIDYTVTETIHAPLHMVPTTEDNIELRSDYGYYNCSTVVEAGRVMVSRMLRIHQGVHPPEAYKAVKEFFDKIRKVEKRNITYSLRS